MDIFLKDGRVAFSFLNFEQDGAWHWSVIDYRSGEKAGHSGVADTERRSIVDAMLSIGITDFRITKGKS